MLNVGDTVYLIYVGYVTVTHVKTDGIISVHYNGDVHDITRSKYRRLDEMQDVRNRDNIADYTLQQIEVKTLPRHILTRK